MVQEVFTGWLPAQIANHYRFPLGKYTGRGQSIGIISLGGKIDLDELFRDCSIMRIQRPRISVKNAPGISRKQDEGSTIETHLDAETIGSLCPDADITIYRGVSPTGFAAAVQQAVEDRCDVISISWGGPERHVDPAMEAAFRQAREQGATVCVAAGDAGSSAVSVDFHPVPAWGLAVDLCRGLSWPAWVAQVSYPASSPHVLACGGTEMVLQNGRYRERVWNNVSRGGGAGGGGVSRLFEVPDYQSRAGIDIRSVNDGYRGRVVPDVAGLAAFGDCEVVESGREMMLGGTSAAAPLWASFIALINEGRAQQGKDPLGFINDKLYALAARGGVFDDIVDGTNSLFYGYPGYGARVGFDACTGWGTPRGTELADALLALD